jgi:hypothetical protein
MATHGGGSTIFDMADNLVLFGAQSVAGLVLIEIAVKDICHLKPLFPGL